MDNTAHISFNAADRSYLAILKKEIHKIATDAGLQQKRLAELDIVVAEIASNLVKHGSGGEILARKLMDHDNAGLELISIDSGAGMAEPAKMMKDGMSTANTLGQGLGAIQRLSDSFDLYSLKDWGTILVSRIYNEPPAKQYNKTEPEVKYILLPKPGEVLSGDGIYIRQDSDHLLLFAGDGLGHGPEAHKAVQHGIDILREEEESAPVALLRTMHPLVKKTRGFVGTIATYRFKEKEWRICGIGNIATRTVGLAGKSFMSYNGVVGMTMPGTLNEQVIKHERGQTLVLCSDGIKTRWDIVKYPGILKHDLSILAAAIYKDHARRTDDMSVLVSRIN